MVKQKKISRPTLIFLSVMLLTSLGFFSTVYFFGKSTHDYIVPITFFLVSIIFWGRQPIRNWQKPFVIIATTLLSSVITVLLMISTLFLPGSRNPEYVEIEICNPEIVKYYGAKDIGHLPDRAIDIGENDSSRSYAQSMECVDNFYKGKGTVFSENPPGFESPKPTSNPEYIDFNGKQIKIIRVSEGEHCEGRVGLNDYDIAKCATGLKCQFRQGTAQDAPGTCVKE